VARVPVPETQTRVLSELRALETARRRVTDFAHPPRLDERFGADPYRVAALPDGRLLALLRGSAELRLYDAELRLLASAPAPRRASALAVSGEHVFATGELSGALQRYELSGQLRPELQIEVPGLHSLRAIAAGAGDVLYAASEEQSSLFSVLHASSARPVVVRQGELGRGVQRLWVSGNYLVAACTVEHALVVHELDARGLPTTRSWRAEHDGPFWGLAVATHGAGLVIAASGVEDHPLDRRIGSFGHVDSFVYVYELDPGSGLRRRLSFDASDLGVLTPRALALEATREGLSVFAPGYGSAQALRLTLSPTLELSRAQAQPSPPGVADLVRTRAGQWWSANPLLDELQLAGPAAEAPRSLPVASSDARSALEKLGEALEFTSLMAPANPSRGPLSRFTCETCHFEGGIDGRIHHTGRGDVLATTKPLRGLFNNRPYFSRALDPDLTQMVHNEFRAAGAGSGRDPWFGLELSEHAWLKQLGVASEQLSAAELREALLAHFMLVEHPPNPAVLPPRAWTDDERRGAQLFRQRCESCHEARLVSDAAGSRLPFDAWHDLIFSEAGPILWARDGYEQTGIVPLVHPRGARVPSLRRVYAKYPYFTNGSARSLEQVLEAVSWSPERFFHRAPAEATSLESLSADEQRELKAFLQLL
jgi:hypothetical protein